MGAFALYIVIATDEEISHPFDIILIGSFLPMAYLGLFGEGLRTGVCSLYRFGFYSRDSDPEMYKRAMYSNLFAYILMVVILFMMVYSA